MNKTEVQWLREQEDKAYKFMERMRKKMGSRSSEFREARAEWYAYHNMCMLFDIPEVVQDGESRT